MAAAPEPLMPAALAEHLAAASLALARRFAAGGTLWCWAPAHPSHAHHVAVEFVHPVIVGTRALPAVAVTEADAAAALRPVLRPGDVLLAITPAADAGVARTLRRAQAWGALTVWLGAGARPDAGTADHVLWLDGDNRFAAHDGRFVLVYHLLWELTHVCFEHPGLLKADEACDAAGSCITCSDEGRLGEIVTAREAEATVRTAAGVEAVDTSLVGPVRAGDLVLIHAGTAIALVDP